MVLGARLAAAEPPPVAPEDTPARDEAEMAAEEPGKELPPVRTWLEAEVELHRRGFSCGSIDGIKGTQTVAALRSFQRNAGLRDSGELDKATQEILRLTEPALTTHVFTAEELARIHPVPDTWLGKSELESLDYGSALELVAETHRASPNFLKKLNPGTDWEHLLPGVAIKVTAVRPYQPPGKAARLHISLSEHELEAIDETGKTIAHFPVSIAKKVEKRPVGELHVTVIIPDPNYTFDPEVFPESEEGKELGRKLIIPPGPNNPVGVAWVGLDRPGYGMHGTPDPEKVGRTESHGCFRLANWDAKALLELVWIGLPVDVEP